ncbi:MAG: hypothetical protein WDM76_10060 [Limisphaerales bacterium]
MIPPWLPYHYDVVEINGIHITASAPVSVYGMYYEAAATAAFTCYPTALLGTNLLRHDSRRGGQYKLPVLVCDCGHGGRHHGDHHAFAHG